MYLEERLMFYSHNKPEYKDKLTQWQVIKQSAVRKLDTVKIHFPHFSKHDKSHTQTIGNQIEKLLGHKRIDSLSCSDVMMMLASFYLHDIGMALEYEEIYKKFISEKFKNYLIKCANEPESELYVIAKRLCSFTTQEKDYEHSIDVYNDVVIVIESLYRNNHAERSGNFIAKDEWIKHCLGIRCQKILAEICEQHQKPIQYIMELPQKENGIFDDYMHPRFLAAMLCLGDLLDLDTDRFDEVTLNASSPMPHLSKIHLKKHESVESYLVDVNEISIKSNTESIAVYKTMRQWLDWIQETSEYMALHWSEIAPRDFGNAPRLIQRTLLLNGSQRWEYLSNLTYKVSSKRLFSLLEGGGIYRNKLICIREILQNAVDATIFRFFDEKILKGDDREVLNYITREKFNWDLYKITGQVLKIDDTHVEIRIRDRGIGISTDDIYKIAHVSNKRSKHRQELLKIMPQWIRPSGIFGIGLQSAFLLVDEFVMITKTIDEPPKKITFQGPSHGDGYIIVEEYNDIFTQGTEVRLNIDISRLTANELGCSNFYYQQKKLSLPFLNKLVYEYGNKVPGRAPISEIRIKKWDTVPIYININGYENIGKNVLLELPSFFSSKMESVDLKFGHLNASKFLPELNCHLNCHIYLQNKYDDSNHTYGALKDIRPRFNNAVFYRHEYVAENYLDSVYAYNTPIMPYVDWSIDLLGAEASEILNLNRNKIREDYYYRFTDILMEALDETIKFSIKYLIDDKNSEIGDTILLIYQLAKQYNYREEELWKVYEDQLKDIMINNYFTWPARKEISCKLCEMYKSKIYFVSEILDEKLLPSSVKDMAKSDSEERRYVFNLQAGERAHIINHRAEKIYIAQVEGQFVELVQSEPFAFCDPTVAAPQMDDTVLMRQIIRMFAAGLRGLYVFNGYEVLATPVNTNNSSIKHFMYNEPYFIELPFADYIGEIYKEIAENGYVSKAMDRYYNKILSMKVFKQNLEYIISYHVDKKEEVEGKYKQLIKSILLLLENEEYVGFNKYYFSKYTNLQNGQHYFSERDVLEDNNYLSTVIFK